MGSVFQFPSLVAHVPEIAVAAVNFFAAGGYLNAVLLCVIEAILPGLEIPLAPRGDHFQLWGESLVSEFEADLIVPFAGATVGDGGGALLKGNFDLVLGNYRAGERCSQQIFMLVDGACLQRGENICGKKFFPEVFD